MYRSQNTMFKLSRLLYLAIELGDSTQLSVEVVIQNVCIPDLLRDVVVYGQPINQVVIEYGSQVNRTKRTNY